MHDLKKISLSLYFIFAVTAFVKGADTASVNIFHKNRISLFSLADVRLLEGEFKHILDLDHQYLLAIDPDRLTAWFRREAGLTPKAQPYPFWESEDVWGKGPLAGHIMGFYLSSMAMMYEATGDTAITSRLQYTLNELAECQQANKDGYLLATINGRHVFEDVADKKFTTSNPLINDSWEPVYIMNKIMLGLYGVYTRCDMPLAKDILVKMADWFGNAILNKLSHEEIQKLLFCEHGSINESYIDVYLITGDKKYLDWAKELNDEDMWVPLSQGKDILNGWHANTQIPKFTGFENVYDYTGDKKFTDAAKLFWDIVVSKHTWSIGGNSTGEHFFALKEFENKVPQLGGPESCNSVNMLRLTEILYTDYAEGEKIDYYERVLFNHILSNYEPDSGMCAYYTSMRPGHYKIYGTEFNSFWCCTGTGMESPAKFGQMIYAHDSNSLYVNLFISSMLTWKEKHLAITQKTTFPDDGETSFTISTDKPVELTIKLRHPKWLGTAILPVKINGKTYRVNSAAGDYATIKRVWKNGDKITVALSGKITAEPVPGGNKYVSVLYGPIVLAAKIDNHGLTKADFRSARTTVATKDIPLSEVPSFIGDYATISSYITKEKKPALSFITANNISTKPVELVPFNRIHFDRYAVYFQHFNNQDAYSLFRRSEEQTDSIHQYLQSVTVDAVVIGDSASEKAHRMEGINSSAGGSGNHRWRHATDGGYFMYDLKVVPDESQALYMVFSKADEGKSIFDVYADGNLITTIDHSKPASEQKNDLYSQVIAIPAVVVKDKQNLTVKLQARRNNTAGGVFDIRIIKAMAAGTSFDK